jgi:hypothetical protein
LDRPSFAEVDGGATGIGEPPSPTITTALAEGLGFSPLAAEMAPASIRLAKAAMIVFFMGLNSPVRKILVASSQNFGAPLDKLPVDGTSGLQKSVTEKWREDYYLVNRADSSSRPPNAIAQYKKSKVTRCNTRDYDGMRDYYF